MAFVALVREDVLDHEIWTVSVVSHPVVTDHHHHGHSLELVSVEAPVIEIVLVIAHAIHFQLLLFRWRSGSNPGGSPGESGGPGCARGVSGGLRRASVSLKKVTLGGDGELVSSLLSFVGVVSRS